MTQKIEQIKLCIDYDQAKFYAEMNKKRIEFFNKMLSKYYYHLTSADVEGIKKEKEKFEKALTKNLKELEEIKQKLNKTSDFYEVHTTGWADSKAQLLKKVIYLGNTYEFNKNFYIEIEEQEDGYTEIYLKEFDLLVSGDNPAEAHYFLAEEINDTYMLLFYSEYKDKLSKGSLKIKEYFKNNVEVTLNKEG
jgi:hypothetical protein